MKYLATIAAIFLLAVSLRAQEADTLATKSEVQAVKDAVDGVNETVLGMLPTLQALAKIKFTGYIQSQFQVADSDGVKGFAGGDFAAGLHQRFHLRRARLKMNYDNDLTQFVLQIDVAQTGLAIKDAYISIKEPWLRTFTLTSGVFDRPFGFEISYSSSNREAPERTRMYQTLFPGERDLGVKIEAAPESGPLSFLNFKGGFFNGTRENTVENDNNKDFIGRLGLSLPFDEANLSVDGGVSMYSGNVRSNSRAYWTMANSKFTVDSSLTNYGKYAERTYIGADVQLTYDLPVIGGMALRGEYITGKQPGTAASNSFYNNGWVTSPAAGTPLYMRNFAGFYINYIQNIGMKNQFVLKYDEFDPNTDIEGSSIGLDNTTSANDVKYTTLGVGWIYHWDANVKFTVYYDMVTNEKVYSGTKTAALYPFTNDLKDNVLTVRMQYKF
jgi:hypothetical protein